MFKGLLGKKLAFQLSSGFLNNIPLKTILWTDMTPP